MPFLSVIVPIYNAEQYLEECLDSIMQQTFKDYEVILVNDGATDRSPQICQEYVERYDNVHLVNKENGGLVSARKAGLAKACGKYIGWVDSDDCIVPEMFEKMCQEAKRAKSDIVICDMWSWSGEKLIPLEQAIKAGGVYAGEKLEKEFYPYMLYAGKFYSFGILPSQVNKIIRSSIIKTNMEKVDDKISIGEDAACTYFCMLDAESISYLKGEFLYKYRANYNSMCLQWKKEKIISASALLNFMYKRIKEYHNEQIDEQFWYYFVCMYTNVYFEYGIYAYASHNKVQLMNEEIKTEADLIKAFTIQMEKNLLQLPYDRKIIVETVLCGDKKKALLAQIILKIRCLLMFLYRRYQR